MDKRTLQQAIITSRDKFLNENYMPRDFSFSFMQGKATVITGARRSGKTSMLRSFAHNLVTDGLDVKRICYLHFFDDMFAEEYVTVSQIADAYFSMYPELYNDSNVYFILDEIEMLKSWGAGISGLLDSHPVKVLITGSSGKMLSYDIGTELRGRCLEYAFYPLSFVEFLAFNGININQSEPVLSKKTEAEVQKLYGLFLERGSFPEVAIIEDPELRRKIFSSYFDAMYSRDIMERYEVGKGVVLRAFMRRMFRSSGQPQRLGKIENTMKSLGYSLSRPTIQDYMNMMKNAAIISEVPIYGTEKNAEYFPKKYYAVDHAFAAIFTPYSAMVGVKAEHAVHAKLLRLGRNIFYYRSKDDYETDFLVADEDFVPIMLIQVTDDLEASKEREIRGLLSAMRELRLKEGYILSCESYEDISVDGYIVHIRPVYEFLLSDLDKITAPR